MLTPVHRLGRSVALLSIAVAMWITPGALGQAARPPAPPSTSPAAVRAGGASTDPATLIAQLSSDNYQQRQKAEAGLIALGEAARKPLEDFLKTKPDEDTRTRVESTLQKLDSNRSTGPSLITVHATDRPASEVIDAIARQANAQLILSDAPPATAGDRHLSIDLDRAPFWEAMQALAERSGIGPDGGWSWNGGEPVGLTGNGDNGCFQRPHAISGPFLIVAMNATIRSQMAFGRPTFTDGSLILELYVMAEPKVHVTGITNQDWLKECVDENGKSLVIPSQQTAMRGNGFGRGGGGGRGGPRPTPVNDQSLMAILYCGSAYGRKIAHLRGEIHVQAQFASDKITIPDLLKVKAVTKTSGDFTVVIHDVTLRADRYVVSLTLSGQNLTVDKVRSLLQTLHVGDAQGHGIGDNVNGTLSGDKADLEVTCAAGVNGKPPTPPDQLDWPLLSQSIELVQKFDLQDLPLP